MLGWVHSSEGKEESRGKDQGESWEAEGCGEEEKEEENSGVPPTALRWGAREKSHLFGGGWGIPDCGI